MQIADVTFFLIVLAVIVVIDRYRRGQIRQQSILRFLNNKQQDWTTLSTICSACNLKRRHVYRDVAALERLHEVESRFDGYRFYFRLHRKHFHNFGRTA